MQTKPTLGCFQKCGAATDIGYNRRSKGLLGLLANRHGALNYGANGWVRGRSFEQLGRGGRFRAARE